MLLIIFQDSALNFSASESVMSITATECWASFALYLANVAQFDATIVIIIGSPVSTLGGLL
jgi:hypothetical protein